MMPIISWGCWSGVPNFEVYFRHHMAERFENMLKDYLQADCINYYYEYFVNDSYHSPVKRVWCGKGLVKFIQKVLSSKHLGTNLAIFATSSYNKGGIQAEFDIPENETINSIWIGDVRRDGVLDCGHGILVWVWDHILNKKAK